MIKKRVLPEGEAKKTIDLISEGKIQKLLTLVPEGLSPKLYVDLVKHVMGTDKDGGARPDEDFLLFLYVCKRTGLDPLIKQIYPVYRWNSRQGKETMTIQAGIDGMRLVAQRSGVYAGQDDATFDPADETAKVPRKASVTCYKMVQGTRVGFTGAARWAEYAQFDNKGQLMGMWVKMPYNQLAKCAEALALRKGFPNELSGIYSEEEMAQASNPLSGVATPEKFIKTQGEIEVVHGAASDAQVSNPPAPAEPGKPPEIGTDEAAKQSAGTKRGVEDANKRITDAITKARQLGKPAPDFKKMREEIKNDDKPSAD